MPSDDEKSLKFCSGAWKVEDVGDVLSVSNSIFDSPGPSRGMSAVSVGSGLADESMEGKGAADGRRSS